MFFRNLFFIWYSLDVDAINSDYDFYYEYLSELKALINKSEYLLRLKFSNASEPFQEMINFESNDENMYVQIRTGLRTKTSVLTFLRGLLEEEGEEIAERETINNTESAKDLKKVFIVHGHDGEAKQIVARFLEKLKLEAIILHERSSGGRTIIEKLEHYTDVHFAIVLLTPDDIGGLAKDKENPDKLSFRARQNVVFELGYMIAKIGRANVCALLKGDIEKPTDYDGVIYISMDENEGWKKHILRELLAANIPIDISLQELALAA